MPILHRNVTGDLTVHGQARHRDGRRYLLEGDEGAGGGAILYTHEQGTPAAVWDINHGLGTYPAVTVVDSAGTVGIPDVDYLSNNEVRVTLGAPVSGKAYLIG
ncbi:MAG: hypothetical protein KF833_18645 [Verrucomicrobiae bacterium]|nr:hypothetical protein [Verrucomicrobiae bacterium]